MAVLWTNTSLWLSRLNPQTLLLLGSAVSRGTNALFLHWAPKTITAGFFLICPSNRPSSIEEWRSVGAPMASAQEHDETIPLLHQSVPLDLSCSGSRLHSQDHSTAPHAFRAAGQRTHVRPCEYVRKADFVRSPSQGCQAHVYSGTFANKQ